MNPALIERANAVHWEWMVYLEMWIAGIAAGAYATAALLEWFGQGRSPIARAAHLLTMPLMALAALLLIVDLSRPERFFHMIVQVKTWLPSFKPWSPMSIGSWLVLAFPVFAFVSFVDALIDRGMFRLGSWRRERTLHGSSLGRIWATLGGLLALGVGTYSGVLLSASEFPGWADSSLIGALFVVTALATGMAALLVISGLGRAVAPPDLRDLARAATFMVVWQMVLLVMFVISLGPSGARVYLTGPYLLALIGAAILAGIAPIALLRFGATRLRPATAALGGITMLLGGFLLRYAIVMGPQAHG